MAKHGPKPKSGARYPSGDLRPVKDGPTPEHARQRQQLVGSDDPKKQPFAEHELGIRFARHDITGAEFGAGRRYARLFRNAVQPLTLPSILGNLVAGGSHPLAMALLDYGADEERGAQDRADYLDARRALGRCGSRTAGIVDEIAVYGQANAGAKGEINHADFCRGLDALSRHFEVIDERARTAAKAKASLPG